MRSNVTGVVLAVIALAFAGAAYYYWTGGGKSDAPVTGVVVDKVTRQAGTEAGDDQLAQGMRLLTGESLQKPVFYYVVIETGDGEEIDIEVPPDLFETVQVGDRIRRADPEAVPVLVKRALPPDEAAQDPY